MSGEMVSAARVAVCVPAGDDVKTFWAYDYAGMMVHTQKERPDIALQRLIATGSLIPRQRETLARAALESGQATHLLWLDTDLRFPKDTLLRMLARDVDVVAAGYTERSAPFRSTVFSNPRNYDERYYVTPNDTGLRQVHACGFGCVLIRAEVFRRIPEPWFLVGYVPHSGSHVGEDIYFWKQCAAAQIPVWLDQDLTKEVAHIGRFEFGYEHALRAAAQRLEQEEAHEKSVNDARQLTLVPDEEPAT